jgi:LPS export ABC transporter protein LptC
VKRVLLLALVLAIVVPAFFLMRVRERAGNEDIPESFMEDVRVVNMKSGARQWTLEARKALIPSDGKPSRLSEVSIELPEQGMRVSSDAGLYDFKTRDLELSGNIRAITEDFTILADSVRVESDSGELSSPDKVTIESASFKIEGEGFVATGDRKVVFKHNVKAILF